MRWKDAIDNMQKEHPEDSLIPLYTSWGEKIIEDNDYETIWQEHPRPQLQRKQYQMLNGKWDYLIADTDTIIPGKPFTPVGSIHVPFSPESLLSGVQRQLLPKQFLWYQRTISFSQEECDGKERFNKHCILHFDAVDQQADIYVNGTLAASHLGGYLPFQVDITDYVSDVPLLLQVRVQDDSDTGYRTRGKQTLKRGGMFYTAQSGIWQSVWYEWVPKNYISRLRITPDYDNAQVTLELNSPAAFEQIECIIASPSDKYDITSRSDMKQHHLTQCSAYTIKEAPRNKDGITTLTISFADGSFQSWTPETPFLYSFTLKADEDELQSYFAMRSYTIEPDEKGIMRFHLNHKPYFLHGLLDQGYWSDGLMTAPCDEAFIFDIQLAKDSGFNMLRKHIKIEPLRWYYHCDRLGMLVWQDMVNGGTKYNMLWVCYIPTVLSFTQVYTKDHHYRLFSRISQEGRSLWEQECMETIEHLYNVPSLCTWIPFNEGWGQFDAARISKLVKEKDPTRPVDHASGWFDQKGGDYISIHNYFRPLKAKGNTKRAFVISEYGGYACHISGHSSVERIFGYKKFDNPKAMVEALSTLFEKQLFPLEEAGLSGAVYTQLSDIEEEVNGLVTYDRKIVKLQPSCYEEPC